MVVLDRTLTPAGQRRLKDLRCLGRGSEIPWPSPGVFSVVQLAEKILIHLAQTGQGRGPRDLISNETLIVGLWARSEKNLRLTSFRRELKEALKLAPLGLSFEEWKSVLFEMEESNSSSSIDLKLWSERILLFLNAISFAESQGLALTMWDHVERVLREVNDETLKDLPWRSMMERNPFHSGALSFTVPELQDPQPLEDRFLKHLPLPVLRLRAEANDEFPLNGLPEHSFEHVKTADDLSFAWAFDTTPPGPVETVAALSGDFPIDIAVKNTEDDNEELRVLSLFCSSLANPTDTLHPFFRYQKESRFLETWSLNPKSSCGEIIDAWLRFHAPEISSEILATMRILSYGEVAEVFAYFAETPLFAVERPPFSHPRLDPRGAPLVTLVDLPFMGSRHFALWGASKDLEKHLAATSTSVLKNQDFPPSLRKLLESRGLWMPDPEREQRALLGAFAEIRESLCMISPKGSEVFVKSAPQEWRIPELVNRKGFSPSALEAYAECSLKFYTERVLRPERVGEWDAVPIDPLHAGQWVHAVLEDFLKLPDWSNVASGLDKLLQEHRTKIFLSPHSAAYEKILELESDLLVEKLSEHLLEFERPLLKIMGVRSRIETETAIQSRYLEHEYYGKIDRLDHYSSTTSLLWDYKTGTISKATSIKQIENHKFQWHLYRELLKTLKPELRIAGGGYLNPLEAPKSRLIAFADLFDASQLADFQSLCAELGHPLEILADDSSLLSALSQEITQIRSRLSEGYISATGDSEACRRCSSQALCGKPYFEGDPADDLT